uniref:Uncharacterized protein n=1 Tax=Cacopsylla melanoneura TaxID=428564 RepID=A0A8D9E7P0_9HEMI
MTRYQWTISPRRIRILKQDPTIRTTIPPYSFFKFISALISSFSDSCPVVSVISSMTSFSHFFTNPASITLCMKVSTRGFRGEFFCRPNEMGMLIIHELMM